MTLDDGTTTINLPDSLNWVDEYKWSDVKQDIQKTIGGGLVIQESIVSAGRPITLESGDDVWITKDILDSLVTLINTVDKTYTLTLTDLTTHTVIFDRTNGEPFSAEQVLRKNVPENTDYFTLTLKLIKV